MARPPRKPSADRDRREVAFRTLTGGTIGCAYLTKRHGQGGYTDRLHDEYVGVFVLRGRGVCFYGDPKPHSVGPGDFIQHFPGHRHGVLPREDHWQEFYFRFPEPMCRALAEMGLLDTRPVLRPGLDAGLLERFERLLADMRQAPPRQIGVVMARMHELLVTIQLLDRQPRASQTQRWVDAACEALGRHPEARLDIAKVAGQLGLSYDRFRKLFRGQVGVSPGEYRIRRRIDHAQHLLAQERLSVKAAAYRLGYPDPYTFSKQFKRYTGQSPTAFREMV